MAERACSNCGAWYYRVNKLHLWTRRNPGHRTGWVKIDERLCLRCSTEKQTMRVCAVLAVKAVPNKRKKRA